MLDKYIRLGVNIDHVATLRNARGGAFPSPIDAALLAKRAGADGITAHLREDRRHIQDNDIIALKKQVDLPLNFEMAATQDMQNMALSVQPNAVCLVPESRAELTTEGGLNVAGQQEMLREFIAPLKKAGIRISLFVDTAKEQLDAAAHVGADIVELHTGHYCDADAIQRPKLYHAIKDAASYAYNAGLEVHAGHGLNYDTASHMADIEELVELNIGHFLICDAVFIGLEVAIANMKKAIRR